MQVLLLPNYMPFYKVVITTPGVAEKDERQLMQRGSSSYINALQGATLTKSGLGYCIKPSRKVILPNTHKKNSKLLTFPCLPKCVPKTSS